MYGLPKTTGFSKPHRVAVAILGIVLLLVLTAANAWHRDSQSPNCHICKICKMPVAVVTEPADVRPRLAGEVAVFSYQGQAIDLAYSPSNPRSPPRA